MLRAKCYVPHPEAKHRNQRTDIRILGRTLIIDFLDASDLFTGSCICSAMQLTPLTRTGRFLQAAIDKKHRAERGL